MKKIFNKIRSFSYGGESRQFFLDNNDKICQFNIRIISIILSIMTIVPLIYLIFFLKGDEKTTINMKTCCLIYFLVFLLVLEIHHFIIKKNLTKPTLYYIFICELIFSFLIFVGPIYDSTNIACFIPMFFMASFLLTITPFNSLILVNIINFAVFIIIDKIFKTPTSIFILDLADSLTALALGLSIGYSILKSRINQLQMYDELKSTSESELKEALDKAYYDTLTGVKSRSAYQVLESKISKEIRQKAHPEFAIVYCDINDLKGINDSLGHSAGDTYIIKCAKILENVFKNSPIFRLSGDEFMIFLQNEDYNNRKQLMEEIKYAPFASGIAVYDYKKDASMRDVVSRADHYMYNNKDQMKLDQSNQKAQTKGSIDY